MVSDNHVEVLAIVQARGGSKSIPRKNIRPLAGHPLLSYSIAAGLAAENVSRLIVSTDSEEIAQIAMDYGAEVPFLRPTELALDDSPDYQLFDHALGWLRDHEGYQPDIVMQLRPTSPLRPSGLVDKAVEKIRSSPEADCVRSVTIPNQNPYKMWRVANGEYLDPLIESELKESYNMPRQRLPKVYWQTGHIDVIKHETIAFKKSLTGDRVLSILVDPKYCVDIDADYSWEFAEWLIMNGAVEVIKPEAKDSSPIPRSYSPLPEHLGMLILDFDGVLTDNRVWISEDGTESVVCDRRDGMGLEMIGKLGVEVVVISSEVNQVVEARCRKLKVRWLQGTENKKASLRKLAAERRIDLREIVYVGNDHNDLGCFNIVGCAVAVADAQPEVRQKAKIVLKSPGGRGAVREVCDLIIKHVKEKRLRDGKKS